MKRIMTPKEKKYLAKVLDQIVSETEIDYGTETVFAHFFLIPFHNLHYYLPMPSTFARHCRSIYGVTYDEIDYIWDQYKSIMIDKIKDKPLNESTEDNALNKIVDQLVGESKIDYGTETVFAPTLLSPDPLLFPLFFSSLTFPFSFLFFDHCRDMYGLTEKEAEYVWKQYRNIIINKINNKPLNESTHYYSDFDEDSFIIKTVNQMVKETKIWVIPDYWYKMNILLPFNIHSINIQSFDFKYWGVVFEGLDSDIYERVNNYFNSFGVTEEEKDTVWDIYTDKISDMVKQKIESN